MQNKIIYRNLNDIKKLKNNPRFIREKAFKILCESIKNNPDYFEARPIILSDRTGELIIISGNQRYEAAKFNKLTEVPTILLSGLTEEREAEIIIRDNISNGEWDFDMLANEWDNDKLIEWGVDVPTIDDVDINELDVNKILINKEKRCPFCNEIIQ